MTSITMNTVMKTQIGLLIGIVVGCHAEQEFINLGFNEPDLSHVKESVQFPGRYLGPADELIRGWSISKGNIKVQDAGFNTFALSPVFLYYDSIFSQQESHLFGKGLLNVLPDLGPPPGASINDPLTLSQSGMVPKDAKELIFTRASVTEADLEVQINGINQIKGESKLFTSDSFNRFEAIDVSQYAGTEINLTFVFRSGPNYTFDVYGFEPPLLSQIPEPETIALMVVGGVVMIGRHLLRKS